MATCRSWCFTAWEQATVDALFATEPACFVVGRETCPTTGKEHFRGYIRWKAAKRFSWWKNTHPTVHVEPRKGSEIEAAAYCRKDGSVLHDFGVVVDVESTGDVTEHVLDLLESRAPLSQVYRAHRKFFFPQLRQDSFDECFHS